MKKIIILKDRKGFKKTFEVHDFPSVCKLEINSQAIYEEVSFYPEGKPEVVEDNYIQIYKER